MAQLRMPVDDVLPALDVQQDVSALRIANEARVRHCVAQPLVEFHASKAEISRTDARGSALATEALGFLSRLSRLGLCFGASVRDQIIGEVSVGCEVGEHSSDPFRGFSP